jgi:hypothetical protein
VHFSLHDEKEFADGYVRELGDWIDQHMDAWFRRFSNQGKVTIAILANNTLLFTDLRMICSTYRDHPKYVLSVHDTIMEMIQGAHPYPVRPLPLKDGWYDVQIQRHLQAA